MLMSLVDGRMELTPFHGHLIVTKQGVKNVRSEESQATVSARISPASDRTGQIWVGDNKQAHQGHIDETNMFALRRLPHQAFVELKESQIFNLSALTC